jgi:hypothetical protein
MQEHMVSYGDHFGPMNTVRIEIFCRRISVASEYMNPHGHRVDKFAADEKQQWY